MGLANDEIIKDAINIITELIKTLNRLTNVLGP